MIIREFHAHCGQTARAPNFSTCWATAACLALAAMTSQAAPVKSQLRGAPIKVGAVSSLTGPAPFPESTDAVRAYFEVVNAAGGVKGRTLQLIVIDDKADPAVAKAGAKSLAEEHGVVAHMGSASIVECTANADYYRAQNLVSIQGTGVEPSCFDSSHIVPINTGPYLSVRNALEFASGVLRAQRPCVFILDIPGMRPAYEAVITRWSRARKVELASVVYFQGNETPQLLAKQAVDSKCDAVVHTGIEPMVVSWVKSSRAIPALRNVPKVFLTPAYTSKVAAELGDVDDQIYTMAEFEPWSSRSAALSDWKAVMQKSGVPLSSFAQGGYSAALVFVKVLQSMPGDITRESIRAALRKVEKLDMPMAGTSFSFGTRTAHNPNRAVLPMKLSDGRWRIAHPSWIIAPE